MDVGSINLAVKSELQEQSPLDSQNTAVFREQLENALGRNRSKTKLDSAISRYLDTLSKEHAQDMDTEELSKKLSCLQLILLKVSQDLAVKRNDLPESVSALAEQENPLTVLGYLESLTAKTQVNSSFSPFQYQDQKDVPEDSKLLKTHLFESKLMPEEPTLYDLFHETETGLIAKGQDALNEIIHNARKVPDKKLFGLEVNKLEESLTVLTRDIEVPGPFKNSSPNGAEISVHLEELEFVPKELEIGLKRQHRAQLINLPNSISQTCSSLDRNTAFDLYGKIAKLRELPLGKTEPFYTKSGDKKAGSVFPLEPLATDQTDSEFLVKVKPELIEKAGQENSDSSILKGLSLSEKGVEKLNLEDVSNDEDLNFSVSFFDNLKVFSEVDRSESSALESLERELDPDVVSCDEFFEVIADKLAYKPLEEQSLKIKLYPRELGEMKIALTVKAEVVEMKLEVENPLSQKLIEEQLPVLKKALESQGLQLGEFSLGTNLFNHQGTNYTRLELASEFSELVSINGRSEMGNSTSSEPLGATNKLKDGLVDYRV